MKDMMTNSRDNAIVLSLIVDIVIKVIANITPINWFKQILFIL